MTWPRLGQLAGTTLSWLVFWHAQHWQELGHGGGRWHVVSVWEVWFILVVVLGKRRNWSVRVGGGFVFLGQIGVDGCRTGKQSCAVSKWEANSATLRRIALPTTGRFKHRPAVKIPTVWDENPTTPP